MIVVRIDHNLLDEPALFVFNIEHKDTDILGIFVNTTPNIQILYELRVSVGSMMVALNSR